MAAAAAVTTGRLRPSVARALLRRPTCASHLVQLYEDAGFLADVVAEFVDAGFAAGEPALVVARAAHRERIVERLRARGSDVDAHVAAGRLRLLDAAETMTAIAPAGVPDRVRFGDVVGAALADAARAGGDAPVRVYGEIVDLLWADRKPDAALALEELWNDLGRERTFSLLCAYHLARFSDAGDGTPLAHVLDAHSHVLPADPWAAIADPDERLREVARLQQRARALENEVAERRQVERALRESLRVRDDFLAVAGHELRTPLTAAQLMLESLARGRRVELPPLAQERIGKVARSLGRLAKLIDGLVDVAHFAAGSARLAPTELELGALVRGVVDEQLPALQAAGCTVELIVEDGVLGRWDRRRLEQVVANLVSNAGKYGVGTPITVRVERGADSARVVVRDRGVGIAPGDHQRIFERFERAARPEIWGLGVGLWIAREAVEAHGGTITLDSALGQGATFTVQLPYAC